MALALSLACLCFMLSSVGALAVESSPRSQQQQQQQYQGVIRPLFETVADMFLSDPVQMLGLVDRFLADVRLSAGRGGTALPVPDDVTEAVKRLKALGRQAELSDGRAERLALDETGCETCKLVLTVLKRLLDVYGYETLEWPVIRVCYWLEERGSNPMPELQREHLCNGSVSIQGPHVAHIINSSKVERICQLQNACWNGRMSDVTGRRHTSQLTGSATDQVRRRTGTAKVTSSSSSTPQGRSKSKAVITVAQLTDIHVDVRYLQGQLTDCQLPICCSNAYGPGTSGPFGDYKCNIPPRTIDLFLRKVAAVNPDIILYSGDISGSRVWNETLEEILSCSSALTTSIAQNLPGNRVYPTFGNHEMFPTNLYFKGSPDIVTLTNQLTDWWTPIAGFGDRESQTMRFAGFYSTLVLPQLRLIQYNSNYMYSSNFYNVLNYDDRQEAQIMMSFVESELQTARNNGEKVILMGHHPTNSGDYFIDLAYWYRGLIVNYADIIVLQIAGHRHCDAFNLIENNLGQVVSMIYMAPPITGGGTKNPSMRVYTLDADSFEVLDYDQYYLDLKTTYNMSPTDEPEIVKLYSARDEYSLSDLSPASWSDLVDRMETDSDLLLKHVRHYYIDSRENIQCNPSCQRSHICSLRNWAYDGNFRCLNDVSVQLSDATTDWPTSDTSTLTTEHTHLPTPEPTTPSTATHTRLNSTGLALVIILALSVLSLTACN